MLFVTFIYENLQELSYDAEQTSNQLKRFEKLLHEGQTGNDHNLKAALESCERTVAGLKQEIADMCAERYFPVVSTSVSDVFIACVVVLFVA